MVVLFHNLAKSEHNFLPVQQLASDSNNTGTPEYMPLLPFT
jgi:hypothetical protein